jgi:hypothetical protein
VLQVIATERSTTRLVTFLEKRAELDLKYAQVSGQIAKRRHVGIDSARQRRTFYRPTHTPHAID